MMRVLIVDMGSRFHKFGGQQRCAALLAHNLPKSFNAHYLGYPTDYIKENDPKAIIIKAPKSLKSEFRRSKLSENIVVRIAYNLIFNRLMLGVKSRKQLLNQIKEFSPEVVVANSISDLPLLKFLRNSGIDFKSAYIDHGSVSTNISSYLSKEGIPLTLGSGVNALSIRQAKRKFFSFFDSTVALSKEQEQELKKLSKSVAYIPNGLSYPNAKISKKDMQSMKSKLGFGKKDFVILYVGKLFERQKGVKTLIKAFTAINSTNMRLLIVGNGPDMQEYMQMCSNDKRVLFSGALRAKKLALAYAISDVFVLPSFWEGFSLTLLEAASMRLPIIISKSAYIKDLKKKSIGGMLSFNAGDSAKLKELILKIKSSQSLRKSSIKSSQQIKKSFTEEKMLKAYSALLKRISTQ